MNDSFDVKNESVNTGDEQTKMKFHSSHSASLTVIDPCLLLCIGVCCLVSLASFIVFIHQGRGAFTLRDDFNTQVLPFYIQVNRFLKSSLPGQWCWALDLGASFVNGFGYYALGSPFAWLTFLLPPEAFPYVVGWVYMLKYVCAGTTAYLYLKTMTGKGSTCEIIGAVAYAFSGFQATNILFYFFHDVVALFPLLLIGMEYMMRGKSSLFFSFAVFINCLTNYYFFIGECLFLVLYYCFRFGRRKAAFWSGMIKCFLASLLGVGMACVLFLPSAFYILGNPRTGEKLSLGKYLFPDLKTFLFTLKGMLLPGDTMHDHAAVINANWNSAACWIPLTGCTLPLAYIIKKRDWLSTLLIVLGAFSFSPFFSSAFVLFTQNYKRWWYMLVLMAVLAGVYVLHDRKDYPVRISGLLNLLILSVFCYAVFYYENKGEEPGTFLFHPIRFKLLFFVSAGGILLTIMAFSMKKMQIFRLIMLIATSIMAFATTFYTINRYRQEEESTQQIMDIVHLAGQLADNSLQYRYEFEYWDNYYPLIGNVAGVGAFSSTCGNYRFVFQDLFNYWHPVRSMNKSAYPGLSELLGARYVLKKNPGKDESIVKTISVGDDTRFVVERPACPIGFKIDHYILHDDLMLIKKEKRGIALLHGAVINQCDENRVRHLVDKITKPDIDFEEDINNCIQQAEGRRVEEFERNSIGLTCQSNFEEESLIYFSVPSDPGWKITIDGVPSIPIDSGGMILLPVPSGKHRIVFRYLTPGLREGALITTFSVIFFMILMIRQIYKGLVECPD